MHPSRYPVIVADAEHDARRLREVDVKAMYDRPDAERLPEPAPNAAGAIRRGGFRVAGATLIAWLMGRLVGSSGRGGS
jgi:hypothetical protein